MQFMLQPCHILLAALIRWANERQRRIIEFQNDQIEALLKLLGKKRLLLTDVQGLEKLTQLKSLNLGANQLTDVQGLEKLTHLEMLNLYGNPNITKAQIAELQMALPKCNISHNVKK